MSETSATTMTVVIRDLGREHDGGPPCILPVTISAFCPACCAVRGHPQRVLVTEAAHPYFIDTWHNGCGHADNWESVLAEVAGQCARPDCVLAVCADSVWDPYCSQTCSEFSAAVLDWYAVLRSYLHRVCPAMTPLPRSSREFS